jgi:uncharacterized delta-60 repeat protein
MLSQTYSHPERGTTMVWRSMPIFLVALTTGLLPVPAQAAPGDLDPSFGSGGTMTIDFASSSVEKAMALAVQADGKLVATGSAGDQYGNSNGFALARLTSIGGLDSSFGAGGEVTTDFPSFDSEAGNALVLQPDGKLVVAGSVLSYATGEVFALARYNPDGSLDSSFGSGGLVSTVLSTYTYGGAKAVALQPDGKLVVAGTVEEAGKVFGVARYNPDGSLDTTFGSGGLATALFYYWESADARGIAIQPDGKIVVGGTAGAQFVLARFNPDGTLDGTFGSGGIARLTYGYAYALALQPDGKIVEVGTDLTGFQFAVARANSDGSPDTSFAGGGAATTGFSPTAEYAAVEAVRVQANGKIVAAGTASGNNLFFALARFNPDGTLDSAFGTDGNVLTSFPSSIGQSAHALALQADGGIVAAGSANLPDGGQVFALARYLGDSIATSVPFSAFRAKLKIAVAPEANDDAFKMKARFTLGDDSNGINPLSEDVTLQIGTFSTTLPAGSFIEAAKRRFEFEGVINGVAFEAVIQSFSHGQFLFKIESQGADLTGTVNPVPGILTIGNDTGSTSVDSIFK